MRLVEPWIKVEKIDGQKIMKKIERACRTCYRSEGNITDDSYKKLLTNCITRGHESVREFDSLKNLKSLYSYSPNSFKVKFFFIFCVPSVTLYYQVFYAIIIFIHFFPFSTTVANTEKNFFKK